MTFVWFMVWWIMLSIGVLIYDIQSGDEFHSRNVLVNTALYIAYFPMIILAIIIRYIFEVKK